MTATRYGPYRVQFQTALAHEARGKSITLTRDMRWRGRLPLGLLATAAVEGSDGLLDRATLVLSVLPTRSAEGWLNYPGPDYDGWKAMCVDELGVDPVSIPVSDLTRVVDVDPDPESYLDAADADADAVPDGGMEVRGWTVVVRPPEGGAVTGVVRMVVMTNGDYWKFRSLLPRSPS